MEGHKIAPCSTVLETLRNLQITENDFTSPESSTIHSSEGQRRRCGETQLDLKDLREQFNKACPDFDKALEFATTVIFKISTQIKRLKMNHRDEAWKLRFLNKIENQSVESVILVKSFIYTESPKTAPKYHNNKLELTIEQASLLALTTLATAVPDILAKGVIVTTPLSDSIFSRECLINILNDINAITPTPTTMENLIRAVIQSCQSGGHLLEYSEASIAVAASVSSTQHMRDKTVRDKIIARTFKNYLSVNKQFNEALFHIYCKYTFVYPDPMELMRRFEEIQQKKRVSLYQKDREIENKNAEDNTNCAVLPPKSLADQELH